MEEGERKGGSEKGKDGGWDEGKGGGWDEGKGGGWDEGRVGGREGWNEGRVEVLTKEDRSIRKHSICIPLSHVTGK